MENKSKENQGANKTENDNKSEYYIIYGEKSGVYFGKIKNRVGQEATITDARNIWYWSGAASLLQLARDGVTNPKKCKFTVTVEEMVLTDVICVIPCTVKAEKIIKGVDIWKC